MADANSQTVPSPAAPTVEDLQQQVGGLQRFLAAAKQQRNDEADRTMVLAAQLRETTELVQRLDHVAATRAATIADLELKLQAAEDLADERGAQLDALAAQGVNGVPKKKAD